MTTRITGPDGETIYGVYVPPRMWLTVHDDLRVTFRPATTWEIASWQVKQMVRRWLL